MRPTAFTQLIDTPLVYRDPPLGRAGDHRVGLNGRRRERRPRRGWAIPAALVAAGIAAVWGLAIGANAATAAPCANEALRTGPSAHLPDCRAYELVTPAFKYGQLPYSFAAADAEHFVLSSLGAFGEAEDDVGAEGSFYDAKRTWLGGWQSAPLEPPAGQFQNSGRINSAVEDVSEDFERVLLAEIPVTGPPIDQRYYLREHLREPTEALDEVGPLLPPAAVAEWKPGEFDEPTVAYAGASRNLSHLLFYSAKTEVKTNFLWPGDSTVAFASLYEYVGTGHTGHGSDVPHLVGVKDNGEPITQCGVYLGSYEGEESGSGDTYNAISQEGEKIFFTARKRGCSQQGMTGTGPAVDEVFARDETSPGVVKTVAISEPSKEDCAACETYESEPAARSAAIYQGASSDGKVVYFISEQHLLPGAEGRNLYEYSFEGAKEHKTVTLVQSNVLGVVRVSEHGKFVYFVGEGYKLQAHDNETGATKTIATLSSGDSADWGTYANGPSELTPNGQFLLFASSNDLTPDAEGIGSQLYRYDFATGEIVRISIGQNGFNHNGNTGDSFSISAPYVTGHARSRKAPVSISEDGEYVFFQSPAALTEQALNDVQINKEGALAANIYEYHGGQVYLLSDGRDVQSIYGATAVNLIGASPTGSDVFFTTSDPLVSQDNDTQVDVYDARVEGGFPASPSLAECSGEACRGASVAAPGLGIPASTTLSGSGNLLPVVAAPAKKTPAQIRAAKLKVALKACKAKRNRKKRQRCESTARKRYGKAASAKLIRTGK